MAGLCAAAASRRSSSSLISFFCRLSPQRADDALPPLEKARAIQDAGKLHTRLITKSDRYANDGVSLIGVPVVPGTKNPGPCPWVGQQGGAKEPGTRAGWRPHAPFNAGSYVKFPT
jgi:hypothetical protein